MSLGSGTDPVLQSGSGRDSFNVGAIGGFHNDDVVSLEYDPVLNKYTGRLDGTARVEWIDTGNTISHGVGKRGFAVTTNVDGGTSGFQGIGFDDIYVTEIGTNIMYAPVRVVPISVASQSVKTGATTLYVRASRSAAAATVSAGTFNPQLHVMAIPA
jgi:hypothetical protein